MATDLRAVIEYPSSDGKRMADNTLQFECITTIKGGVEAVFRHDPNVFVAADLLWYPVEGEPEINVAPDILVAFGRPAGHRKSYLQWKEANISPQVVFEIVSESNKPLEMIDKYDFYETYGVEEYYLYDPIEKKLRGWLRRGSVLRRIPNMNGWVSPRLKIRFEMAPDLVIYDPDGQKFLSYRELVEQRERDRDRADRAEAEVKRLEAMLKEKGVEPGNAPPA